MIEVKKVHDQNQDMEAKDGMNIIVNRFETVLDDEITQAFCKFNVEATACMPRNMSWRAVVRIIEDGGEDCFLLDFSNDNKINDEEFNSVQNCSSGMNQIFTDIHYKDCRLSVIDRLINVKLVVVDEDGNSATAIRSYIYRVFLEKNNEAIKQFPNRLIKGAYY